jgi:hypothetical protein
MAWVPTRPLASRGPGDGQVSSIHGYFGNPRGFDFQDLDPATRGYMLSEWEAEEATPMRYRSEEMTALGHAAWPTLMRESIVDGDDPRWSHCCWMDATGSTSCRAGRDQVASRSRALTSAHLEERPLVPRIAVATVHLGGAPNYHGIRDRIAAPG